MLDKKLEECRRFSAKTLSKNYLTTIEKDKRWAILPF